MDKKEKLKLKLKVMKEVLNSSDPSSALKEIDNKYPEIIDEKLKMLNESNKNASKKRNITK